MKKFISLLTVSAALTATAAPAFARCADTNPHCNKMPSKQLSSDVVTGDLNKDLSTARALLSDSTVSRPESLAGNKLTKAAEYLSRMVKSDAYKGRISELAKSSEYQELLKAIIDNNAAEIKAVRTSHEVLGILMAVTTQEARGLPDTFTPNDGDADAAGDTRVKP